MSDQFVDRVAALSGHTTRACKAVADALESADIGMSAQAETLRRVANEHASVVFDCFCETQPIELHRFQICARLKLSISEISALAVDLEQRSRPGGKKIKRAVDLLISVLHEQPDD